MFSLQRELFHEERLITAVTVVNAAKARKKTKTRTYLCITVKRESVALHKVKVTDDSYSKRKTWALEELRLADGGEDSVKNREFVLQFDKPLRWLASDVTEKNGFLFSLWTLCNKYLDSPPEFVNVNFHTQESTPDPALLDTSADNTSIAEQLEVVEHKELSTEEEQAIESVLASCDWAVGDAEAFAQGLTDELVALEEANIFDILHNEQRVDMLMNDLDAALEALQTLDTKISQYDGIVRVIRKDVARVAEAELQMRTQTGNYTRLHEEVHKLVTTLDLDPAHVEILQVGDLNAPNVIKKCVQASAALQMCLATGVSPGLSLMDAVNKRNSAFRNLQETFANRLVKHFQSLVAEQAKERVEYKVTALNLRDHEQRHNELLPLAPLLAWLHSTDPESKFSRFASVCDAYAEKVRPLYRREIKGLFEAFRNTVSAKSRDDSSRHGLFNEALQRVLATLINTIVREQEVCQELFGTLLDAESGDQGDNSAQAAALAVRQQGVTKIVKSVFDELLEDFRGIIELGNKLDPFNSLVMLVKVERHTHDSAEGCPFLQELLATALIFIKRHFDSFIDNKVRAITESKAPKKSQVGVLPFVMQFSEFVKQSEEIVGKTDRRSHIDKAYVSVLEATTATIEAIASECKNEDVVMFENFHRLYDEMSRLKVECLQPYRPVAQEKCRQHRDKYVQSILGRPLAGINEFFQHVERLIRSGVAPQEVGFQMDFSKAALRKCIKEYPGKEVKKGVEAMYKRVQKQLSQEEGQLVVVWRSIQEEFVKRHQHFEKLIEECYPGSNIHLEFDVSDLLSYFSSLAG
eukprot:m.301421 g.301421  ORF g.301421 m.301421 type:complete len:809 (+) comp14763_c0_seq1:137-2563(+)